MDRSVALRRSAPVAVFAAVLAGLLALNAVGGGDDGTGAPRPLKLSAGARGAEARSGGAPMADTAARAPMPSGEIVIPDRLLDGVPTKGPAYDVTPGDTARIGALAKALGVAGEVRSDSEGWVVGEGDRVLRVFRQAGTTWYLGADKDVARPADGVIVSPAIPYTIERDPNPDAPVSSDPDKPACEPQPDGHDVCVAPQPADCPPPPDGAEPACPGTSEPYEPSCEPRTDDKPICPPPSPMPEPVKPPQPSDSEARAVAQRVFDALGLNDPKITLNDAWTGKEVVAAPAIGGLPTVGFETRVTVLADGTVAYASGFLGGTKLADEYPLLAPRDAVKRGGGYGPRIMVDYACPENEPCPTPEPREATGLRLGLQFMSAYDGTQESYLAPAWLLTFPEGTWEEPVLALPDEYVATPPPATDTPLTDEAPVPVDGGGSDGSTGSGVPGVGNSGGLYPGTAPPTK